MGYGNGVRLTSAVVYGTTEGGNVRTPQSISIQGHSEVYIAEPRGAFGSIDVHIDTPAIQVQNFQYGVLPRLVRSVTSGSGTVTTGTGTEKTLLKAATGTTPGSVAMASSARQLVYKAGQGIKCMLTARYTTPVAGTKQAAGFFDVADGVGFGYDGLAFGILHRSFGQREIRTLTVTAAATGAETATVTLNGVTKAVVLASGSKAATAYALSAADYSTTGGGWDAYSVVPTVGDPTVVFVSRVAASLASTYSLSSTGAAAGTFAQTTAGAAPTDTWIPKTDWSIDQCTGAGGSDNPSGFELVPTNINVLKFQLQYLGNGNIFVWLENSVNGQFFPVHIIERAGEYAITSLGNASLPVSIMADNGATNSNIEVANASMYAATEGERILSGPGIPAFASKGAITSEAPIITVRNDLTFNGQINHSPVLISLLHLVNTGGNQFAQWRVIRNAVLTGASFARVSGSSVSIDTSATAYTGGEIVSYLPQTQGQPSTQRPFDQLLTDVGRIFPGDALTLTLQTSGSAMTGVVSMDLRGDY